jgi:trans-aconitate methyltransferase
MANADHWNDVYHARDTDALTWHQDKPGRAFELIKVHMGAGKDAPIVDIGGGSSGLAGALLDAGYGPITVLDLSQEALARAQERLGSERSAQINWQVANVATWQPNQSYALWHDRAVFHFLTDPADRRAYARALFQAVKPGGLVMISTFADDGPERCSGLVVRRYAPDQLQTEIGQLTDNKFTPIHSERLHHVTPKGSIQKFQISLLRCK